MKAHSAIVAGLRVAHPLIVHLRRPTRLADFPYLGCHQYSLRFATSGRRPVFAAPRAAEAVIAQIQKTCDDEKFAILAYCLMHDHLHLVIAGTGSTSDLRRCAKLAKQRADYVIRQMLGIRRLWQHGYYERILRSDEATMRAVRYVLENPVRGGLVERAEDYPFSLTFALRDISNRFSWPRTRKRLWFRQACSENGCGEDLPPFLLKTFLRVCPGCS